MRNLKRLMAVAMLAVIATLGAQTAKADGVLLSDRSGYILASKTDGVLLSDKQAGIKLASEWDILSVVRSIVDGVLLSD